MQIFGQFGSEDMNLAEVIGGDEDSLRTFIAAYFGQIYGFGHEKPTIYVGHIVDGYIASLPLPDNIHIIGSIQRIQQREEVLLMVDGEMDNFRDDFFRALEADGWQIPEHQHYHFRGFVERPPSDHVRRCHPERNLVMNLSFTASRLVKLEVHQDRNPCDNNRINVMDVMPILMPPAEIGKYKHTLRQNGGGSNRDRIYTAASLITKSDLAKIDAHYRQELEKAGWKLVNHQGDDYFATSRWDMQHEGEDWRGLLVLIGDAQADDIQLRLEMNILGG